MRELHGMNHWQEIYRRIGFSTIEPGNIFGRQARQSQIFYRLEEAIPMRELHGMVSRVTE